jgi:hypothetical protein
MSKNPQNLNLQNSIETIMKNLHYQSYDEWIKNFALNLPEIWNEESANKLKPKINPESFHNNNHSIVIGRGPSLKKHKHLELLASSNYNGSIVCTDGSLISVLESGITPEKFKKFYVVTIDPYKYAKKFYDNKIVDKFGNKISAIFSTISNPLVVQRSRESGMKICWVHSLFDYHEGKKSFNQISALMVRAKNHSKGLPGIQTGGNSGTASWFISWKILQCNIVTLIGINHAWEEGDSWEKIITHGRSLDSERKHEQVKIDQNSSNFKKLFKKIHNPDFDCNCIIDPLFQFYSNALKEFISRSPEWLITINSTEGGSIFGERIKSMKFYDYLQKYNF